MNRMKKSLIVAAVFLGVGITGSIISGIYMVPKVINEVYRVQREIINADVPEREVFTTAEEVTSVNIKSLRDEGFDVEIRTSADENTRVKVNEYMENSMKVESNYSKDTKELTVIGERSIYNLLFQEDSIRGFFENGYDAFIAILIEERNVNSQIVIEVPKGVDINFNSGYSNNLIIKDNAVLKNNLIFNSHYGYVNLPKYNNLKNISIETGAYIEMDLREIINAENVTIEAREIHIASKGFEKEYSEVAKVPSSITLSGNNVDIDSYMPIGQDVRINGSYISYETNFKDYGMNVEIENNIYNVNFDGEELGNSYDLDSNGRDYSGYIGRGENKGFNLRISGSSNCEFEHIYPKELEEDIYD